MLTKIIVVKNNFLKSIIIIKIKFWILNNLQVNNIGDFNLQYKQLNKTS